MFAVLDICVGAGMISVDAEVEVRLRLGGRWNRRRLLTMSLATTTRTRITLSALARLKTPLSTARESDKVTRRNKAVLTVTANSTGNVKRRTRRRFEKISPVSVISWRSCSCEFAVCLLTARPSVWAEKHYTVLVCSSVLSCWAHKCRTAEVT